MEKEQIIAKLEKIHLDALSLKLRHNQDGKRPRPSHRESILIETLRILLREINGKCEIPN